LPAALVTLKTGASARDARRWLAETGGNVREAIEAGKKRRGKMKVRK
jgi:N-acetylmuramic acid 6-phosphate (MurNAc-6-P) etherase